MPLVNSVLVNLSIASTWPGWLTVLAKFCMQHSNGFIKIVDDAKKRIKEVTIEMVLQKIKAKESFYLVDIREDDEWRESRIVGAIHIGKGVIERDIEDEISNLSASIVLYCGGGSRSALAADALRIMGYQNVTSMTGGIRGWKSLGMPIDDSEV